jgi:two-component system nitrogen regulation response regulator NtrX
MPADVLVVDDEADIRDLIAGILEDEGHTSRLARDSDEALRAIEQRRPHLVILDIWLQGSRLDGLEVLNIIKKAHPTLPVVIISGHGNIETAVTAIKRGAYDYIEKPFKADRLLLVTLRALEASKLQREVKELRERSVVSSEMIGKSPAINQLRSSIDRVAPTNSRVLIRGGAGSGKELVARVMHGLSQRKDGPFVVLSAAAMAPDRVEEELFGTEDHTGPRKVGALEEAHGGTLYIDEVADMPVETQGKVLRVLVEQKFQRVGGGPKVAVDVRIISSTSRELERDMAEGRFREDLYHRLNVVPLRVPGLAERRDDIPELITYFVVQVSQSSGLAPRRIGEDAIAVLQAHDWPGNVRELKNVVERCVYRNPDPLKPVDVVTLDPFDSPYRPRAATVSAPKAAPDKTELPTDLKQSVADFEIDLLNRALEEARFNQRRAAEQLGLTYHQLRGYLKKYNLLKGGDVAAD